MLANALRNRQRALINFTRRYDSPHSPMHQVKNGEAMRSELFPSLRRIDGRKGKLITLAVIFANAIGRGKTREATGFNEMKTEESRLMNRVCAPFFQAIEDLRFLALEDRTNEASKVLVSRMGKDLQEAMTSRFEKEITDHW